MKNFKKIMSGFLALSLCGTICTVNALTSELELYYVGDINNNDVIDITDLRYLRLFLSGSNISANDYMTDRLDVDQNDIIDYRDVNALRAVVNHQNDLYLTEYDYDTDLIETANDIVYKKIEINGNSVTSTSYNLEAANPIPEITSRQSLNYDDELSVASVSNDSGIVKITATINNETVTGTGFVVDDNTILTAASNLCKKTGNTWRYATNVSCDVYTISGTHIQSGYNAVAYHIPSSYITVTDNTEYNYAAIKLNDNVDLYDYKMDLGVPTTNYDKNVYTISESAVSYGLGSSVHSLCRQKVHGEFINYSAGIGGVAYGAPVYFMDNNSNITVIGIASKYFDGFSLFNRAVRIDQDILRFIYDNSDL